MAESAAPLATWNAFATRRRGTDDPEKCYEIFTFQLFSPDEATATARVVLENLIWSGFIYCLEGDLDSRGRVRLWNPNDPARNVQFTLRITPPFFLSGTSTTGEYNVYIEILPEDCGEDRRINSRAVYEVYKQQIWKTLQGVLKQLEQIEFRARRGSITTAAASEDQNIVSKLDADSLLEICMHLENFDPRDLCRLAQTCKALRVIASSNYVWHHMHTRFFGDPEHHMLRWNNAALSQWLSTLSCCVEFPWKEIYRIERTSEGRDNALMACKEVNPGTYLVRGFTRNSRGNVTHANPFQLKFGADGSVNASVPLQAGSEYNPSTISTWVGTVNLSTRLIQWDETLPTHRGIFKYSAEINNPRVILGNYYWDIQPAARGTCEWTLVETASA